MVRPLTPSMWNEDDHRALRELLAQDDISRAERDEWMARREPPARPYARETDDAGVIYRDCDNDASLHASELAPEAFDDLPEAVDEFSKACVERFHAVDREIAFLKGQLDVALGMLGLKSGGPKPESIVPNENNDAKAADIIDLPPGFWKRNAA